MKKLMIGLQSLLVLISCVFFAAPGFAYDSEVLSGTVLETMDADKYTYVQLETEKGKIWLAAPKTEVSVGKEMSFRSGMKMVDFESRTLGRTFESIIFSPGPAGAKMAAHGSADSGHHGQVVPKTVKDISIEKAPSPNGYTIAEVFKNRSDLHNKKASINGKVVKVARNIMGKNWIHLQDGTGSEKEKTHDLVVTSKDLPSVGEIVNAQGTLFKDKDIGGSYQFSMILEDATIKKQS